MTANNVVWRPHPGPQTRFLRSGILEILYGGAAGGGKSVALIAAGLRYFANPFYRGKIFRRTRTQATELILKGKQMVRQAFPGAEWKGSEHAFIHPAGGRLEIGYLRHDDDLENEQGQEYQFVGFDELTQFYEHQYTYLFSRLRSPHGIPLQLKATANPGGVGHLWVKGRFVDPGTPETVIWESFKRKTGEILWRPRTFIPARLDDNPSLGIDYEISLSALPPAFYQALREGDWNALLGAAFPEFDWTIHRLTWARFAEMHGLVLEANGKCKIPDHWPRFMSIDWGSERPFSVGWWCVDDHGTIYRYAEWYGVEKDRNGRSIPNKGIHMPTRLIARGILEREEARGDKGKIQLRIADPSMWNSRGVDAPDAPSLEEIMAAEGVFLSRGDNNRIAGRQQIHDRLRLFEIERRDAQGNVEIEERAGMYILEDCHEWLRTVPVLPNDPRNPEDLAGKTDPSIEDHAADETRYMLQGRTWKPPKLLTQPSMWDKRAKKDKNWRGNV